MSKGFSLKKFGKFGTDCAYLHLPDTSKDMQNQLGNLDIKESNNTLKIKFFFNWGQHLQSQIEQLIIV